MERESMDSSKPGLDLEKELTCSVSLLLCLSRLAVVPPLP